MLDLIASVFVRGLNLFFNSLPMSFNLWVGRRMGWLIYALSGNRKNITYANLKAAFYSEKSPEEIKRLTRMVYRSIGESFLEILSLTKIDRKYIDKYVKVVNFDYVKEAVNNPKGTIFLSAHFGNWELTSVTSALLGHPLHLLVREQKMKRLNELLNRLRESKGTIVIRKGFDIKNIFRVLHQGNMVGIGADQNAGAMGEFIDFFGRPASTAIGAFKFAEKSGAWILPALIHRVKGPYHELVVEKPMKIGRNDDVVRYMKEYNKILEEHIRNYPDQWFWMHKRWKVTPLKKVLVLDDGKKGHLKQSMAVVKEIRKKREKDGKNREYTPVDVVRVEFKSKMTRALFNAASVFFTSACQGSLKLLKWAVTRDCYENLAMRHADIIVSCGSQLFGVNKLLKIENYCRNVTIFDPGIFNRRSFNLIIVPRHDFAGKNIKASSRMIVCDLAPNLIDPEELKTYVPGIKKEGSKCLGVLIGGDNPEFKFTKSLAEKLSKEIEDVSRKFGYNFYITTSRRTNDEAEIALKGALAKSPACLSFISGKDDKDEKTVEKILAISDIVLVSGESISMVSEAVSSLKKVIVFMPEKKTKKITKFEKFVDYLEEKKYLTKTEVHKIHDAVKSVINKEVVFFAPEDNKKIYDEVYKLY